MPTKFEKLKQELKKRNKKRQQSPLEKWVLKWFPLAHIYGYELEYQVGTKFIDIAWPDIKYGVELDGKMFHWDKIKDNQKDIYLSSCGWKIKRISSTECWNPKILAYHLKEIYNTVNPDRPISWGLAEILRETEYLVVRSPVLNDFCVVCKHIHDDDEECIKKDYNDLY